MNNYETVFCYLLTCLKITNFELSLSCSAVGGKEIFRNWSSMSNNPGWKNVKMWPIDIVSTAGTQIKILKFTCNLLWSTRPRRSFLYLSSLTVSLIGSSICISFCKLTMTSIKRTWIIEFQLILYIYHNILTEFEMMMILLLLLLDYKSIFWMKCFEPNEWLHFVLNYWIHLEPRRMLSERSSVHPKDHSQQSILQP